MTLLIGWSRSSGYLDITGLFAQRDSFAFGTPKFNNVVNLPASLDPGDPDYPDLAYDEETTTASANQRANAVAIDNNDQDVRVFWMAGAADSIAVASREYDFGSGAWITGSDGTINNMVLDTDVGGGWDLVAFTKVHDEATEFIALSLTGIGSPAPFSVLHHLIDTALSVNPSISTTDTSVIAKTNTGTYPDLNSISIYKKAHTFTGRKLYIAYDTLEVTDITGGTSTADYSFCLLCIDIITGSVLFDTVLHTEVITGTGSPPNWDHDYFSADLYFSIATHLNVTPDHVFCITVFEEPYDGTGTHFETALLISVVNKETDVVDTDKHIIFTYGGTKNRTTMTGREWRRQAVAGVTGGESKGFYWYGRRLNNGSDDDYYGVLVSYSSDGTIDTTPYLDVWNGSIFTTQEWPLWLRENSGAGDNILMQGVSSRYSTPFFVTWHPLASTPVVKYRDWITAVEFATPTIISGHTPLAVMSQMDDYEDAIYFLARKTTSQFDIRILGYDFGGVLVKNFTQRIGIAGSSTAGTNDPAIAGRIIHYRTDAGANRYFFFDTTLYHTDPLPAP